MGKRLKQLLEALRIKQNQFAQSVGVSPSHVSDVLTGRRNGFSTEVVVKIAELYKVNLHWLLTGEGDMFISSPDKVVENDMLKTTSQKGHLVGIDGEVETFPDITDPEQISRTGWWKKLDADSKYIIAGLAYLSPESRRRLHAMVDYELNVQE